MPLGVLRLVGLPLVPVVLQRVLLLRRHRRVLGGRVLLVGVARTARRRQTAAIGVDGSCGRDGGRGAAATAAANVASTAVTATIWAPADPAP